MTRYRQTRLYRGQTPRLLITREEEGGVTTRQNRQNRLGGSRRSSGHLRAPTSSDRPGRARGQPRIDVKPHAGPPAVVRPDRVRPQPPEIVEAGERPLHDPGLREARPLVPVYVAGRKRAGQPAVRE